MYDTAAFGAASPPQSGDPGSLPPTQTINLDGADPRLAALAFDGPAKYTIAQGTGGSLHMDNGAATATITVSSGSHSIAAPLVIDSDTNVTGGSVTIRETTGAAGGTSAVPEPGTWALACTALLGWLIFRRRKRS